ncbi:MAG: leucine-rich repeat protein [Clostridiales bacterium]|nr:leucine-rich repeat protein [Clostridiales bacterium]
MKRIALLMISLLLCFAAGAAAENTQPAPDETYECGDYAYILLEDGSAEVTGYAGAASKLEVPGELDGYPVTTIGDSAFWGCKSLTDITLPDSVTTIGDAAFWGCKSLTDITLPDSVTTIGDSAFWGCEGLTSITLPDNMISIGVNPFSSCGKLQSITVSPDHPNLAMIDNVLFDKMEKKLIGYPAGRDAANYEIPQGITSIGDAAFAGCDSLTDITIPDSVTTIGDSAFGLCDSLTSITLPDSVTSIGDSAFYGCNSLILTVGRDSYAKQYAVENGIQYTYPDANNWLYE